jgi:threonine synthase
MRFVSTSGQSPAVGFPEALLQGLAPDGGLYIPESIPRLPVPFLNGLSRFEPSEIGAQIAATFVEGMSDTGLEMFVYDALDFEIPLVPLGENTYILELFHGPTLAFKDVGARFMARLMSWYHRDTDHALTVIVATSGDTGGAVARAFYGVKNTRVAVLYPRGQVSGLQEKQFAALGGNVQALAVEGTFDDCQRLAKAALADPSLRESLHLTSANSINVGRLLPQTIYYFIAAARLPLGNPLPHFVVPSGNFGNLTAGILAKRFGLPCDRFLAATNANDIVPRYLRYAVFEPRPSVPTLSTAMDVGNPSNLVRLFHLYGGDHAAMSRDIAGIGIDDETTKQTIRQAHASFGYLMDPHTAVGYAALQRARSEGGWEAPAVVLSTAHPGKFREELGGILDLEIPVPVDLEALKERPVRSLPLAVREEAFREFLLGW